MDANDWDARYDSAELVWGAEPNRFVERECRDLTPGRAVDLACGEGRNTWWLARQGWDARGYDFSPVAVERARALADGDDVAGSAVFEVADVTSYDALPDAPVDLVVVAYVHLPADERTRLFTAAVRALADGGHLVVVGHDRRNVAEGVSGPQDVSLLYDSVDLLATLEAARAGLHVVSAGTEDRPTDAGIALDTVVHVHA